MSMANEKDFKTLVAEYKENHNCGIIDAAKAITTQYPEAHEKYIQTLKQKWDSSPELRKEFGDNFDSCLSYFKHEDDCPVTDQKVAAHATIKDAWDSMPELRKEFGGDFTSCKSYFENEFKTTGKMSFKS